MEALLKTSTFKEFVITDNFLKSVPDKSEHVNYTTQLEFGILGLLWCSDTQENKAKFFYKLVNPENNAKIAWTDKELKTMLQKFFYFSNEMVTKYSTEPF